MRSAGPGCRGPGFPRCPIAGLHRSSTNGLARGRGDEEWVFPPSTGLPFLGSLRCMGTPRCREPPQLPAGLRLPLCPTPAFASAPFGPQATIYSAALERVLVVFPLASEPDAYSPRR